MALPRCARHAVTILFAAKGGIDTMEWLLILYIYLPGHLDERRIVLPTLEPLTTERMCVDLAVTVIKGMEESYPGDKDFFIACEKKGEKHV
jgi:hypothetical protein